MKLKSLGFIGGGRISSIVLQALANRQIDLSSVQVCDADPEILKSLQQKFPKIQTSAACESPARQEIVFIALHPPVIMEALDQIKASVSDQTQVISLAPKITMEKIASKLATQKIARMIPNATSFINEGFNPVSFSAGYSSVERESLLEILKLMGNTFEVEESKLEAYAVVSAMLPTYFWFQWNEIQTLGLQMGLNEPESREAVRQTLWAAIDLLYNSQLNYREVTDLIPVKPIGEHEAQISEIFKSKLMGLFQKIRP